MNGDSTQQLYVSTFKMRIQSSSSLGNGPASVELRSPQRSNSAGKSCRGRLAGLITQQGV